jgi:hypothetical protein
MLPEHFLRFLSSVIPRQTLVTILVEWLFDLITKIKITGYE